MTQFATFEIFFVCSALIFCFSDVASSEASSMKILFPGKHGVFSIPDEPKLKISEDKKFTNEVNSLSSMDDFEKYFGIDKSLIEDPFSKPFSLAPRFGGEPLNGDKIVYNLAMAECQPEFQTVPLNLTYENGETFFPTCVRVKRCGGCCYLPNYSCLPNATEVIQVKVLKTRADLSKNRRRTRSAPSKYIPVKIESHISCECGCTMGESSCNPEIHKFNEDLCSCDCTNSQDKTKCTSSNIHKWNDEKCSCECRNSHPCSSGQYYDHSSCRCELI